MFLFFLNQNFWGKGEGVMWRPFRLFLIWFEYCLQIRLGIWLCPYVAGRFSPASDTDVGGENALEQPSPAAVRIGQHVDLHVLQDVCYSTVRCLQRQRKASESYIYIYVYTCSICFSFCKWIVNLQQLKIRLQRNIQG